MTLTPLHVAARAATLAACLLCTQPAWADWEAAVKISDYVGDLDVQTGGEGATHQIWGVGSNSMKLIVTDGSSDQGTLRTGVNGMLYIDSFYEAQMRAYSTVSTVDTFKVTGLPGRTGQLQFVWSLDGQMATHLSGVAGSGGPFEFGFLQQTYLAAFAPGNSGGMERVSLAEPRQFHLQGGPADADRLSLLDQFPSRNQSLWGWYGALQGVPPDFDRTSTLIRGETVVSVNVPFLVNSELPIETALTTGFTTSVFNVDFLGGMTVVHDNNFMSTASLLAVRILDDQGQPLPLAQYGLSSGSGYAYPLMEQLPAAPVPEPAPWLLMLVAGAATAWRRRAGAAV